MRPLPESSGVRKALIPWFTSPPEEVRGFPNEVRASEQGEVFQARMTENADTITVTVTPRDQILVDVYSDDGIYTELAYVFIQESPGAWALTRDSVTGKPLSITLYLASDSKVFARFTPGERESYADLVIFGAYAVRKVEIGVPFERLYTASFKDIKKWTPSIPWYYTQIPPGFYEGCERMVRVIRNNADRFAYAPDACYDENGTPISILTGEKRGSGAAGNKLTFSDAGFLKWIVDGLIAPFGGESTRLSAITRPTVSFKAGSFQGGVAEKYNLSFSLDWTRNLASAALAAKSGRPLGAYNPGVDVAVEPFALAQETAYTKDAGYPALGLYPLLYVLAATSPDVFYLAAIRQTDRGAPEVRFFSRCAAIFPYFDSAGQFHVVVFENGVEMSLTRFIEKYKDSSVHLTRVQASTRFDPK
jgi:hypothetical protein